MTTLIDPSDVDVSFGGITASPSTINVNAQPATTISGSPFFATLIPQTTNTTTTSDVNSIDYIKQQNTTIQNRLDEIQNGYDVNDQKYYYLTLTRRYGAYIATLFVWLYWVIYLILLIALLNSTKFSKNTKIIIAVIMFLFPFYRAIYNILLVSWNFIVDMFTK